MSVYNLIEYSNSKSSGSLWKYYRDKPNDNITESKTFKYKSKITGKTPAAGNRKDVKKSVLLKHLNNFWKTLTMPLINCEINFILTWLKIVSFLLQL